MESFSLKRCCRNTEGSETFYVLWFNILLHLPREGAEYNDERVCLSVCLSVHTLILGITRPNCTKSLCMLPVATAQLLSGGVAVRFVLPVLWITSFVQWWHVTPRKRHCPCRNWGIGCVLYATLGCSWADYFALVISTDLSSIDDGHKRGMKDNHWFTCI